MLPPSWCFASLALAQTITGPARIIDGDTIDVAGQRIRLHGIDAPENKQLCGLGMVAIPCGKEATKVLRRLVRGGQVRCEERDRDKLFWLICFSARLLPLIGHSI